MTGELVGTFRLTAGSCSGGASGSYFRMVQPTGNPSDGPWVSNSDSACSDQTYTLLTGGSDRGLVTGGYQPAPSPGFDGSGNSLATRLLRPVRFFGVDFSASTNPTDLQTGEAVKAPVVRNDGGTLSGDLSAFDATWNRQAFNQGSPKPDGSRPGNTTAPTGTYDPGTGRFTLTWTSQIVSGPFNNFTGLWHLEGTFVPAGDGSVATPSGGGPTATTVAPAAGDVGDVAAADGQVAAPTDEVAVPTDGDENASPAAAVRVEDEGFEAPVWLVLLLAGVGILGVITLLVLGPRRSPEVTS
jgi:hypothetical protein